MKVVKTACRICAEACGMNVYIEDGKIVKVEGTPEHPASLGSLCPKGKAVMEYIYSKDRLKYPMKREGDSWKRIGWDESLDMVAAGLRKVMEAYGAKALAVYVGDALVDVPDLMNYVRRFCSAYGTPNLFSPASICFRSRVMGRLLTYGKFPNPDPENASCILLWGINPYSSSPPTARRILNAKRKGAKLIVIDPRRTFFAKRADVHVQPRPGTDCALALGMLNVIISEHLYDEEFVKRWTVGFEELRRHITHYPPEEAEKITWVPAGDIREIARAYATVKPACIIPGVALDQQVVGVQNARATSILQAITGNVDVQGGWVRPSRLHSDWRVGVPKRLKERPLGSDDYPLFYDVWGRTYGEGQAIALPDALLTGKPYPIKAMIITGGNPALTWPNSERFEGGLRELDFLVVMDLFMTKTAELADVVFPASSFLESVELYDYGLVGLPYVILRRKAVDEVGDSWPDWKFWFELARRLGYEEYFPWRDIKEAVDLLLKPSGVTIKKLEESPSGIFHGSKQYGEYEKRGGFRTPSGKVELYSKTLEELGYNPLPDHKEPRESPISDPKLAREYPLILTTGARILEYTLSRLRNIPSLRKRVPEPLAEVHPATAKKCGVSDGEMAIIETKRGSIKIKVRVTEDIAPRVVSVPLGWSQANVNILTSDEDRDPISGFPALKTLLCRVRKA